MQFHPRLAFESLTAQHAYESEALKKLLVYLQGHSSFYKKLFAQHHINVHNIKSLHDLHFLPTTSKSDVQAHNWDFLCVPDKYIKEYTATSGTMGKPVEIALTKHDLERLAYSEHQSFRCADGKQEDIYQLMLTLDRQFMAGMACSMGIRELGATLIRTGQDLPAMQWDIIRRLQPTSIVTVPSFLVKLVEWAHENHTDLHSTPVQKAICIGESLRSGDFELNALGQRIFDNWPVKLYSTYSSTEMQAAFTECGAGMGGHHQPDLVILEILNERGDLLRAGEYGEVTITTLGVEGMPLLRYRTGDICCFYDSLCSCGRHTRRLSPIIGRTHQMIKYKGTTLYPPAIFDILNNVPFIKEYVVEVFTNELQLDEIRLHLNTPLPADQCELKLAPILQSRLRAIPFLQFHPAAAIHEMQFPAGSMEPVKFIDNREGGLID